MQVRCQNCRTEYIVEDAAAARGVKAWCPSCQHVQVVSTALPDADEDAPAGVPMTTPPGGKSQIGKLALTTRTITSAAEKKEQKPDELFGELEWENEAELEFVVGRSNVSLDPPPPPPSIAPPAQPELPRGQTSAPVDWAEVRAEYDSPKHRNTGASGPRTDEWPETEETDPWRNTPLPALAAIPPPSTVAAEAAPSTPPPGPSGGPPQATGTPRPATRGGLDPTTPVDGGAPRPPATSLGAVAGTPRPVSRGGLGPTTPAPATSALADVGPRTPPTGIPQRGETQSGPGAPSPVARPAETPESCAACGGSLVDADDHASGVCGPCRQRAAAALGRFRSTAREAQPEAVPTPAGVPSRPTALPARQGRRWPWSIFSISILAVCAVLAAAVWWLRSRPAPITLPPLPSLRATKSQHHPGDTIPEGLEARLANWQSRPEELRTPAELLAVAWRDFARDTRAGYAEAERVLEAALVKNPRDGEALGLWLSVQALAHGTQLPDSELVSLIRLGQSGLERMGHHPALLAGTAELLLARGRRSEVPRAQALAREALDAPWPPPSSGARKGSAPKAPPAPPPTWAAPARVTLAQAYVGTSAGLALSVLQDAEQRDATLRRIWNVRGAAHDSAGNPRAALADLQSRLTMDPDHPVTLRALARLWAEVGETAQARKIYDRLQADRRTQDGPALVDMAELRATAEHNLPEAMKLLATGVARGRQAGDELADAQVRLARLARVAGEITTASSAASAAARLSPDDPMPHVQALLVDLDRGAPAQAAAHLPPILANLEDAGLAALLEGRVRAAEGHWQAAAEAFERAVEADPRRTDARLWAGAAWATVGDRDHALRTVAAALEADPFRDGPGIPPLWPGDGLKGAGDRLALLSKEDRDALPLLAESVLRFHQGDTAAAEQGLDRILKSGGRQPLVLAWMSVLAGVRGDSAAALASAREAVSRGRASGFAQFALGSALLATGDVEGARKALREAQSMAPGLLVVQIKLAEVEARTGGVASARERLQRVIVLDPEYASARRALYLLPPEG
jgi:tetratricopeptide (TPR) repeat protein